MSLCLEPVPPRQKVFVQLVNFPSPTRADTSEEQNALLKTDLLIDSCTESNATLYEELSNAPLKGLYLMSEKNKDSNFSNVAPLSKSPTKMLETQWFQTQDVTY